MLIVYIKKKIEKKTFKVQTTDVGIAENDICTPLETFNAFVVNFFTGSVAWFCYDFNVRNRKDSLTVTDAALIPVLVDSSRNDNQLA